ncbi:hypothetical protein EBI_24592 [Enterocytozoon bieneusi H348]|nr:hypothetical protein EBI_24592 [Enterocytozoon bieneusi H348]|eukprot:XP_002650308.1 hypothetical protein EBI_24592 [Enterocytozoon bieneusi H348]
MCQNCKTNKFYKLKILKCKKVFDEINPVVKQKLFKTFMDNITKDELNELCCELIKYSEDNNTIELMNESNYNFFSEFRIMELLFQIDIVTGFIICSVCNIKKEINNGILYLL